MSIFKWRDMAMYYVNLDKRVDRNACMKRELSKSGLVAERVRGILPNEFTIDRSKIPTMLKNPLQGCIGCFEAQMNCMRMALEQNKSVLVMEDDLVICQDIQKRLDYIEQFLNTHEWDVFNLGGTYHINPTWHKAGHPNHQIKGHCDCNLNRDYEPTEDKNIVRTYGCWSTYAYIVNIDSIEKILNMLEETFPVTVGIDFSMILIQPKIYSYAFVPGCVKQYDNESNIGKGITRFSGFQSLGNYWYKNTMD